VRQRIRWARSRFNHGAWRTFLDVARYVQFSALVIASILFVNRFAVVGKGVNLIWAANAIILTHLLMAPRWRWPAVLAVGFAALAVGSYLVHQTWALNLLFNVLDVAEALGSAWFLRSRSARLPRFTDPGYLLRFFGIAVVGMPAAVAGVFSVAAYFWFGMPPMTSFLRWIAAEALGVALVTPLLAAIYRTNLFEIRLSKIDVLLLLLFAAVGFVAFTGQHVLLLFTIYPLLTIVVLRMGQGWAAIALSVVSAKGMWTTIQDRGPLVLQSFLPGTISNPSVQMQVFMIAGLFIIYAVSSVVDELRITERKLKETVFLHNLITENVRDVIILAGFDGRRSYVSPSAARWGGWKREEVLGHRSMDLVHPDDVAAALAIVKNVREGGAGSLLQCRVHPRHGDYIWVEADIRPVHDPATGALIGVLNIVRDIGERKAAEKQLRDAYRTLESLAITDPLTRLANRRHFDRRMQQEWRRGLREQTPLSLLLLDVDFFKGYNDAYGHLRGDSCLQLIAESAMSVVTRASDLVARFGGEEFAIILPATPAEGALQIAHQLRLAICERRIEHAANPPGYVTVSIGCATTLPALGQHPASLLQLADECLYSAKRTGRNRVCSAHGPRADTPVSQAS
jgi:diguanylate cyclase (GGDEF)-like protein/PAS domain S-box-containing protein